VEQLADRGVIRTALDDFGHAWGQRIDRWRRSAASGYASKTAGSPAWWVKSLEVV